MINIQETSQITKIYLVTNCYGDPNKVYIGKTKNTTRENNHRRIYGKNIIYTEIDEINSLERKDWTPLETFWIQYFKFLGFDIQNKKLEGGSGLCFHSNESKTKISNSKLGNTYMLGRFPSIETRNKMSLSHTGRIHSVETRNKISLSNKGKIISQETKDKISLIKQNISQETREKMSQAKFKSILQYDLEGNFIKEWLSITEALLSLNKNIKSDVIGACCRKKLKTAYGYKWKYKK